MSPEGATTPLRVLINRRPMHGSIEILVDGVVAGQAEYSDGPDGVREFPHTVVASEFGGRGLAGRLVAEALRVTREEGLRVILVNSNPATIMTDPDMADATYVEPITPEIVAKIIEKERPDAVLPTMGGQTALNTALALFHDGTLEKYGVTMIGADAEAIDKACTLVATDKEYEKSFAKVELFTIDDVFGGWTKAQKEHFDDGAIYDQLLAAGRKK